MGAIALASYNSMWDGKEFKFRITLPAELDSLEYAEADFLIIPCFEFPTFQNITTKQCESQVHLLLLHLATTTQRRRRLCRRHRHFHLSWLLSFLFAQQVILEFLAI